MDFIFEISPSVASIEKSLKISVSGLSSFPLILSYNSSTSTSCSFLSNSNKLRVLFNSIEDSLENISKS